MFLKQQTLLKIPTVKGVICIEEIKMVNYKKKHKLNLNLIKIF